MLTNNQLCGGNLMKIKQHLEIGSMVLDNDVIKALKKNVNNIDMIVVDEIHKSKMLLQNMLAKRKQNYS